MPGLSEKTSRNLPVLGLYAEATKRSPFRWSLSTQQWSYADTAQKCKEELHIYKTRIKKID